MQDDDIRSVAIYIRVSTSHQIDKDSLPMQRRDLTAYSELILNTKNYVIFEDAGYSGKNTDRPMFQEMMSQIRLGRFTHLLVWKIDRISRNLLDFSSMYAELKSLGVTFVSKNEAFDTSTAMGEAMLKIILVFAELERNMTSERVTAAMISRAVSGKWNGGRVPFGYSYNKATNSFTVNNSERDLVVLIHDKYEELRSLTTLSRLLNGEGYRSRNGLEWSPVTLRQVLVSNFYCGDYTYNRLKEGDRSKLNDESKWVVVHDHHEAIISREQKDRIISILSNNIKLVRERSKPFSSKTQNIHVFGGMVYCGNCGSLMNSTVCSAKKYPVKTSRYSCPRRRRSAVDCLNKSVDDMLVGEFVFNFILNMLNLQKAYSKDMQLSDMERMLLSGSTFSYIDHIDETSLQDIHNVLDTGTKHSIYGNGVSIRRTLTTGKETEKLRQQKSKLERALDRLQNLYLFSEAQMTDSEYITKRHELIEKLNGINSRLGMANSSDLESSITDDEFVRAASQFIISSRLKNRRYIYYKKLASTVDEAVLKDFVSTVISSIKVTDGRITQITFKNGLSCIFIT